MPASVTFRHLTRDFAAWWAVLALVAAGFCAGLCCGPSGGGDVPTATGRPASQVLAGGFAAAPTEVAALRPAVLVASDEHCHGEHQPSAAMRGARLQAVPSAYSSGAAADILGGRSLAMVRGRPHLGGVDPPCGLVRERACVWRM